MSLLINILLGIYLFAAALMMLVILMQRPKSEGLGAAFGGGVTENIFGAQTTNVLTKITGWLAAIFFILTFTLSILYARKGNIQSDLRRELEKGQSPAPVASATPAPAVPGASATASPGPASPAGSPGMVTSPAPESTVSAPTSTVAPATSPAGSPQASAAPSVSASPEP
jgi:preprotein translocase subunit SecG